MITKLEDAARQKEKRNQRRLAGVCLQCGGQLDSTSRRYCIKHSRQRTNRDRRIEKRWKEQGICVQCGKAPAPEGYARCDSCREKRRNNVVKKQGTKLWRDKVRAECVAAYGGKCACCGETEILFLEIDHVNGGGGKHRKEVKGGTAMFRWLEKQGYPQGDYQLLCRNCNYGKYRNGGVCPHKTAKESS